MSMARRYSFWMWPWLMRSQANIVADSTAAAAYTHRWVGVLCSLSQSCAEITAATMRLYEVST